MRAILLPLILILLGIASGSAAGWMLRDTSQAVTKGSTPTGEANPEMSENSELSDVKAVDAGTEFVKLNNQFVVPVVSDTVVKSLVLLSLSLEVETGLREAVFAREPKLRDALLQVMFDHANIGGFDGAFTNANNLDILRAALTDTARKVMGAQVFGVLIVDLARQDV
jgi:flagellar basal body-associated protein FliL